MKFNIDQTALTATLQKTSVCTDEWSLRGCVHVQFAACFALAYSLKIMKLGSV